VAQVERKQKKKVKELQDEKGEEYIGMDFDNWCDSQGLARQHTVSATSQQNGVAEHLNYTLAQGIIAMLNQAQLSLWFWGATVQYLTHILNSTPLSSLFNTTLHTVWNGTKSDFSMYHVFGCRDTSMYCGRIARTSSLTPTPVSSSASQMAGREGSAMTWIRRRSLSPTTWSKTGLSFLAFQLRTSPRTLLLHSPCGMYGSKTTKRAQLAPSMYLVNQQQIHPNASGNHCNPCRIGLPLQLQRPKNLQSITSTPTCLMTNKSRLLTLAHLHLYHSGFWSLALLLP
jgi:hypothetical protein